MRTIQFLMILALIAAVPAFAFCGGDGDETNINIDDDDDDAGECISCTTTTECTQALGDGWVCAGGCCQDLGGDDDTDDDADDDDDDAGDDDTGDDDDDDNDAGDDDDTGGDMAVLGRFCNALETNTGAIRNTLSLDNVVFSNIWSVECSPCREIPTGPSVLASLDWDGTLLVEGTIEIDPDEGDEWIFFSAMDGDYVTLNWGPFSCSDSPWTE